MRGPTGSDVSKAYSKAMKEWKSVLKQAVPTPPTPPQRPPVVQLGTTPQFILNQVPRHTIVSGAGNGSPIT